MRLLVGNKLDLDKQRRFESYEGSALAEKSGMERYIETSALKNIEVTSAINDVILRI